MNTVQYQNHSGIDCTLSVDIAWLKVMLSYHSVKENAYVDIIGEFLLQIMCS